MKIYPLPAPALYSYEDHVFSLGLMATEDNRVVVRFASEHHEPAKLMTTDSVYIGTFAGAGGAKSRSYYVRQTRIAGDRTYVLTYIDDISDGDFIVNTIVVDTSGGLITTTEKDYSDSFKKVARMMAQLAFHAIYCNAVVFGTPESLVAPGQPTRGA